MDSVDRKIIRLLTANARMTVKEIAAKVCLTSPAVSQRLRNLENNGTIAGYTLRLNPELARHAVRAIVTLYVPPNRREEFHSVVLEEDAVEECHQVTGGLSHLLKVRCEDIEALEALISRLQKFGQTNTQIVLATIQRGNGQ